MVAFISHTTVDCRDAFALSEWWKVVLGYVDDPDDPNGPGHDECWIQDPGGTGPNLLFVEVPEEKAGKNRLHFDLRPREQDQDEELAALLAHGATVVADPEGNEFCILRSPAQLAAAKSAEGAGVASGTDG